jgi:radical SAM superfamily enzyme YgiQ (UPF0313 family)
MSNVIIFSDNALFTAAGRSIRPSMRSSGPYRIASEVRKTGLSCQVIEMMTEFDLSEIEELCKKFISNETLIVGFSTTFWYTSHPILHDKLLFITKFCRDVNSQIKIIFGGANTLRLIANFKYDIDAAFLGYAEHYFITYLECLKNKKPLPFPNRILNNVKIYEFVERSETFQFCNTRTVYDKADSLLIGEPVMLEVGRGCIFKCKFCSYPLIGKKKLDHLKDPDIIKQELIQNYENFKIDKYIISDDTFNDSNEKLKYLHEIFTSLPFKIKFAAYLRLDLLNAHRHQIEMLEEMGLVGANFGIESFHEKAARTVGKGMVSNLAKDFLYDLKSKFWLDRIKVQLNLITGLPYETLESYSETEKWILDNDRCLVETVSISALGLRNIKKQNDVWMSEFEKDSEKYGFYWKDDSTIWYNDVQPVKSFKQAAEIKQQIDRAATDSFRTTQGGFHLFSNFTKTYFAHESKSFEEQIKMNRYEFSKWIYSERRKGSTTRYIDNYKQRILNL